MRPNTGAAPDRGRHTGFPKYQALAGGPAGEPLTKNEPPPKKWADALTRFFGTADWKQQFYAKKQAGIRPGGDQSTDLDKLQGSADLLALFCCWEPERRAHR